MPCSMALAGGSRKERAGAPAVHLHSVAPSMAESAVIVGAARLGHGALLAQGAVVRSRQPGAVTIGAGSAVLENCVVVGDASSATVIGRRTVFGHRCLVIGATL